MPSPTLLPKPQGEWGEACFLARALALGLRVSRPFCDAPYDFIVEAPGRLTRVQVKTVATLDNEDGYRVCTARGCRAKRPYTTADVDMFAVYTVAHDCWYIIPIVAVAPRIAIRLRPHRGRGPFEPFREAWWLLRGDAVGV